MRERVVVAGSLAQRPYLGGHTWVLLQYVLGFKELGLDVLFVDRLTDEMEAGEEGRAYLVDVLERFGLEDFALLGQEGEVLAGLPRRAVLDWLRDATFVLNVMGFLDDDELLAAARSRVFLDIDPGFGQFWRALGLADPFAGHDVHVTIGERVAQAGCPIPTCGLEWLTTRQPVVLTEWPPADGAPRAAAFTSVGAWRGPYAPVEADGRRYGLRVHEFRKLATLPRRSTERFEVALDIHPADRGDVALLRENGWSLADPRAVAGDPWAYRRYVQASKAEFMVAKGMYVGTASGWFSDRSICYLASGKPVLAQDTGIRDLYPTGEGLLVYTSVDEAAAGVEAIAADYERHARAARELAEEYFDARKVLRRLVETLGAA